MTTTLATGRLRTTIRRLFAPTSPDAEAAIREMDAQRYRAQAEADRVRTLMHTGSFGGPG